MSTTYLYHNIKGCLQCDKDIDDSQDYCSLQCERDYLKAIVQKYYKWCSDDLIRQKYSNPTGLRQMILDDSLAVLTNKST